MDGRSRVASNLRRLRVDRGISQEALAVDARVSAPYVSGIERAERNPSLDVLERLALALKVDVTDLLAPTSMVAPQMGLPAGRKPSAR